MSLRWVIIAILVILIGTTSVAESSWHSCGSGWRWWFRCEISITTFRWIFPMIIKWLLFRISICYSYSSCSSIVALIVFIVVAETWIHIAAVVEIVVFVIIVVDWFEYFPIIWLLLLLWIRQLISTRLSRSYSWLLLWILGWSLCEFPIVSCCCESITIWVDVLLNGWFIFSCIQEFIVIVFNETVLLLWTHLSFEWTQCILNFFEMRIPHWFY